MKETRLMRGSFWLSHCMVGPDLHIRPLEFKAEAEILNFLQILALTILIEGETIVGAE